MTCRPPLIQPLMNPTDPPGHALPPPPADEVVREGEPERSLLLARLLGASRTCSLEHRVFNAILLLLFITELASTVQNVLARIPVLVSGVTVTCALMALSIYFVSRFRGIWKPLVLPVFLFGLGAIAIAWLAQDGIFGSTPYYFFLLITLCSVLFWGRRKAAAFLATGALFLGLVLAQWRWPGMVRPYLSWGQKFGDLAFGAFLCLLMTAVMVLGVYLEYQHERRRNQDLLKEILLEKEALLQAMVEKHRLLSMVCHDIGNALTIIQLGVDGEAIGARNLARVRFAAGNIQEIIGSVRMLEAIEQGRLPFTPEPVALGPVLDTLRAIFQERLQEQGITLEVQDGIAQASPVLAEPHILANHVLNNLVSNAIKFSPSGTKVTIEVEDLGHETRIGVTDQGMGMPPELLAQLFVPGAAITRLGARGEKGTGLGLITVRSFAELFGGRLHIASQARTEAGGRQGTTASIYLKNAALA